MIPQSSVVSRPRRRLVFALLAMLVLLAAAGGVVLWQRLHTSGYQHTPNAINTGASILYLSAPSFAAVPTQLTMIRTRDGAKLWQYSLPERGQITSGDTPTISEALANGQGVIIANGVVYFVVDPDHLGSPDCKQELTALRASDGAVLWRYQTPNIIVNVPHGGFKRAGRPGAG